MIAGGDRPQFSWSEVLLPDGEPQPSWGGNVDWGQPWHHHRQKNPILCHKARKPLPDYLPAEITPEVAFGLAQHLAHADDRVHELLVLLFRRSREEWEEQDS